MKKKFILVLSSATALGVIFVYFIIIKASPTVIVTRAEFGPIRDSVTGNVKVHAATSFDLISQANARVDWVALLPLGQTLAVEQNQTLIKFVQDDLDRQMDRLLLNKKQFEERKKLGSQAQILLDIKEKELLSTSELAKIESVPNHSLELIKNEVERLRTQVNLEKLGNLHFIENHELSIANLDAEINKRTISSPINGDFSSCFVAPGNHVFPGNLVGRVYSTDRIIEVSLNEEEFDGLSVGLKAGVSFFSKGSTVFDANVSALSATVDSTSGMRKLFLTLLNAVDTIPVGSSGSAEIIKSEKSEALLIPTKSLVGDYVAVVENDIVKFRKVVLGSKNLLTVEVVKGLQKGDKVVVQTPHVLKDGDRIKPTLISFIN